MSPTSTVATYRAFTALSDVCVPKFRNLSWKRLRNFLAFTEGNMTLKYAEDGTDVSFQGVWIVSDDSRSHPVDEIVERALVIGEWLWVPIFIVEAADQQQQLRGEMSRLIDAETIA